MTAIWNGRVSSGPLKHRAKLSNVFHVFNAEHFISELRASRHTQNRLHEVTAFCDDLFAIHRVIDRAPRKLSALAEIRSVGKLDLDDGYPSRSNARLWWRGLEILVWDELYLCSLTKDGGIPHACLIVSCTERSRLVDHHDRHHILEGNIRHFSDLRDSGCLIGSKVDVHLLYLSRFEVMLLQQRVHCVKRQLKRSPHGPFLDVRPRDIVALAKLID